MPTFIPDATYSRLLADLREAALSGEWRSSMAEVLGGVDVLPKVCRVDFVEVERAAA